MPDTALTDAGIGSFLSLLRRVRPESLHFPNESSLTTSQVARLTLKAIKPHMPRVYQRLFLVSCAECILTFLLCAFLLTRKRLQGQLWLMALRPSPYGRIIVPNSIFVLVLGVALYLLAWVVLLPIAVDIDWKHGSLWDWAWIIPLPWTPLIIGAFYSVWGFILSCSPRSPISDVCKASRSRYFLPVCCRPWLLNSIATLLPAAFVIVNLCLTIAAGQARSQAIQLERSVLPRKTLQQLMLDTSSELASAELVTQCKLVWAAYAESWRFCCISLTLFAVGAFLIGIPCYAYGVPNVMFLVQNAFDMSPGRVSSDAEPAQTLSIWQQAWYLITAGKPRKQQSEPSSIEGMPFNVELRRQQDHYYLTTWRLTVLCLGHVTILCSCIPLFAGLPVFLVALAWPAMVVKGDIGPSAIAALMICTIVTILSCTHVALFCTIATFDPIFRAVVGLRTALVTHLGPEEAENLPERPQSQQHYPSQSKQDVAINVLTSSELPTIRISRESSFCAEGRSSSINTVEKTQRSEEGESQARIDSLHPEQSFLDLRLEDD